MLKHSTLASLYLTIFALVTSASTAMSLFSFSHLHFLWGTSTLALFSLYFLYSTVNSTTTQTQTPCSTMDAYKKLHVVLNPDGSLTRLDHRPETPPSSDLNLPISVLSKDLTFNPSKNTWLRIFLPRRALDYSSSSSSDNYNKKKKKLPLVVFFHGGGFIVLSAASTMFHDFCLNMANDLGAVVVSVDYRLAPEHRLPAAYDDAVEALHWIKTEPDLWLTEYADYSECYLMGSSAGGNIAYYAGLRVASEVDRLEPLKIRGLILVQPFFGGIKRTESEVRLVDNPSLPLCVTDLLWELSLPVGVDRDHEYCNPTTGNGPEELEKIKRLGWRVLVTGCSGDPLVDRQMEMVKLMEEKNVKVLGHFTEGDSHGIQDRDPLKAKQLYGVVKDFISSVASDL